MGYRRIGGVNKLHAIIFFGNIDSTRDGRLRAERDGNVEEE